MEVWVGDELFDSKPYVDLSAAYDELKREKDDLEADLLDKDKQLNTRLLDCQKLEDENAALREQLQRMRSS